MTSQVILIVHFVFESRKYSLVMFFSLLQNHGYAVSASDLPEGWQELFINENDKSNEGLVHTR